MSSVGGGPGERDLVFVSYSHDDAAWAQRFQVLLKPLVRQRHLRLWIDADLRAGDSWRMEIARGIRRARVALLLISADYLASDFIMDVELPTLIDYGVRLAPVLIGECLWTHEPRLADVHWLHDIGRDSALSLAAGDRGRRDQQLAAVCQRLLDVIPSEATTERTKLVAETTDVAEAPVSQVPRGEVRGGVFGVPQLPRGYLARDELAELITAVIDTDGGAVGVTGESTAVGLHGQGGIGKTVLAAALARDDGIGHRFPDGVYWVTVGERPDLLGVQLDLLDRLGFRGPPPRTVGDASEALQDLLADRRVLVVVDDVWSSGAALAMRITGARGRVVFTSRDPAVIAGAGARLHRVEVLSVNSARALAAGVLDRSVDDLPAIADSVFDAVGRVALAVALLAAAVRGGRTWPQILRDLDRDQQIFGNHPYANTFKAMQIAVETLSTGSADALLSLAVFPPDTQVPVAAIGRYWSYTHGYTAADTVAELSRFATANLLSSNDGKVEFHDLQHEYLLLHAPLLTELHMSLVNAYRSLLPDNDASAWWRLPWAEPYIWDHLAGHLRRSGQQEALVANVTDPAYLTARMVMGGPHAAAADLGQAADSAPSQPEVLWWQSWITRHMHLLSAQSADAGRADPAIVPTVAAWLAADPTHAAHQVDPDRLAVVLPYPHLHMRWGLNPPPRQLIRVLNGHIAEVAAVAWSPDGSQLASADGAIKVWDTTDGTPLIDVRVRAVALSVAWSPQGTRLIGACHDGSVRIWEAATGALVATLVGHVGPARAAAWSPDGRHVASGGDDGSVRIWDAATGEQRSELRGHSGAVRAIGWAPDSLRLASAGVDHTVRVWSTDRAPDQVLGGYVGTIYALAWSPDGEWVATADGSGTVRQWAPRRDKHRLSQARHTSWSLAVTWSPDGSRLASAGTDKLVRIWDAYSGAPVGNLAGHTTGVRSVAWSPDGDRLASGGEDRSVRVWAIDDGQTRVDTGRGRAGLRLNVRSVTWSYDGEVVASVDGDGRIQLWRALTGVVKGALENPISSPSVVAWSPQGWRLACASSYGRVAVYDLPAGEPSAKGILTAEFDTRVHGAHLLAWSPGGSVLACAGSGGLLIVEAKWSGVQMSLTKYVGSTVMAVAWSADSNNLSFACADGSVHTFHRTHRRPWWQRTSPVTPLHAATATEPFAAAWHNNRTTRDSYRLARAFADGSVRIWNADTGTETVVMDGLTERVTSMAWSPDGMWLAWADTTGRLVAQRTDTAHQVELRLDPVNDLAWGPAGIALGCVTGLVRLDLRHRPPTDRQ